MDTIADFAAKRGGLFYPKADLPTPTLSRGPASVPIDKAQLAEFCRHHLGAAPTRVEPLADQGTQHALFRLTLPNRDVIARINCDESERSYPLHLDAWASGRLRAVGLPALEVYAVDLSRRWLPFDCELLEATRGVSLRDFDHDDNVLSPLLARLGAFLAGVHEIAVAGHGLLVPDGQTRGACPNWPAYLNNHLDRHLAICRDINAIDHQECAAIRRLFDDRLSELHSPARLLHGDPGNHNVFVAEGEVSCLIDWEDAVAGDPVYEVAFWATFHPERRHGAFLDGYLAERSAEPDFWDRFWLYFLRVALAKTVVRHNLGLTDMPGRPPASRRIQRAVEGLREPARAA